MSALTAVVVDEDTGVLGTLVDLLETHLGATVTVYGTGQSFLAAYRGEADVVILDLKMPDIDGYQIIRELQDRGITTPIVLMSDQITAAERALLNYSLIFKVIDKPCKSSELLDVLKSLTKDCP